GHLLGVTTAHWMVGPSYEPRKCCSRSDVRLEATAVPVRTHAGSRVGRALPDNPRDDRCEASQATLAWRWPFASPCLHTGVAQGFAHSAQVGHPPTKSLEASLVRDRHGRHGGN